MSPLCADLKHRSINRKYNMNKDIFKRIPFIIILLILTLYGHVYAIIFTFSEINWMEPNLKGKVKEVLIFHITRMDHYSISMNKTCYKYRFKYNRMGSITENITYSSIRSTNQVARRYIYKYNDKNEMIQSEGYK